MNNNKKRGELQGRGIVYILRRALIIPEKRVVCVVSIVAYQDWITRIDADLTKEEIGFFTHVEFCLYFFILVQPVGCT